MDDRKPKQQPDIDSATIYKYNEVCKTIRWAIVALLIGFLSYEVSLCVRVWMDKPAWLEALGLVAAAIVGPSGVLALTIRAVRRYTKRTSARLQELEKRSDPERSTSGLLPDGRNRPEDRI